MLTIARIEKRGSWFGRRAGRRELHLNHRVLRKHNIVPFAEHVRVERADRAVDAQPDRRRTGDLTDAGTEESKSEEAGHAATCIVTLARDRLVVVGVVVEPAVALTDRRTQRQNASAGTIKRVFELVAAAPPSSSTTRRSS